MNKYKIEIKETLKKEIIVNAETQKDALDFLEKVYFKSDILRFDDRDIETVETKILEENNKKIENKIDEYEEENCEDEEDYMCINLDRIDERINDIDNILLEIRKTENYIESKMNFIKEIAEKTIKNLEEFINEIE